MTGVQTCALPIFKVDAHRSLNTSKAVIRSRYFVSCTEEAILGESKISATSVRRIYIFRDGQKRPTSTLILTFDSPKVLYLVKAGYLSIPVETCVPNPLRCFRCQKFGHPKTKCQHKIICARCGEEGHEVKSCAKSEHCANCQGDHPAYSKDCPKRISEKEVKKNQFNKNFFVC